MGCHIKDSGQRAPRIIRRKKEQGEKNDEEYAALRGI